MDKYNPSLIEEKINNFWEENNLFTPSENKEKFTIPMPPPNVTGSLHAGHALYTVQDIMIRYKRMNNISALWVPGTDHAAIVTEVLVLKNLGLKNKKEISYEKFIKECKKWTKKSQENIINQLKKIGCSCDWEREAYTFDDARNNAVNIIFKKLYDKGLIYRGDRMINWSIGAQSVLSDDEVEWEEKKETFYYIKCGQFIIATVRPETKCCDSPVVINPQGIYSKIRFTQKDGSSEEFIISKELASDAEKRREVLNIIETEETKVEILEEIHAKDLIGRKFKYQTYAGEREFEVIADDTVDTKKGTGSMTISVCHSNDDYEIYKKHKLDKYYIEKIDKHGNMTEVAGELSGTPVLIARKKSGKKMLEMNLLAGKDENYNHQIPLCYRSKTVVEPMISKQWFIAVEKEFYDDFEQKTTTLKKQMKAATNENFIKIIPNRFEKIYNQWIDNLHDWCISRQIWWGHRIPVWYDKNNKIHLPIEQKIILLNKYKEEITNFIEKNIGSVDSVLDYKDLTLNKDKKDVFNEVEKIYEEIKAIDTNKNIIIICDDIFLSAFEAVKMNRKYSSFENNLKHNNKNDLILGEFTLAKKPQGHENMIQDEDTLDTWFSSATWPFSILGWPDKTIDYNDFYPTSLLETGYDIMSFWVSRMIMFGKFATGKYPFNTVYLHGLICDKDGRKMSKSKGNGIDPLDIIKEYGTDALRIALVIGSKPGGNIVLSMDKIKGCRNFCSKLWNINKFVNEKHSVENGEINEDLENWIKNETNELIKKVNYCFENHSYGSAIEEIWNFTWNIFADWIIEISKVYKTESLNQLIKEVLDIILKLLHPFAPFITEHIWQENKKDTPLITSQWAKNNQYKNKNSDSKEVIDIVKKIRSMRKNAGVDPVKKITAFIQGIPNEKFIKNKKIIMFLSNLSEIKNENSNEKKGIIDSIHGFTIFLPEEDIFDKVAEEKRILKEKEGLKKYIEILEKKLNNKNFVEKAPAQLVNKNKQDLQDAKIKLKNIS